MTKKIQLNFALCVLAFIILGSIFAPLLATHNPFEPDMAHRLQGPGWQHFFGTDALGRDMYSRILYGGRASMLLTLVSSVLALVVGVGIGVVCAYYRGKIDMLFTVVSNIFQGIPGSCFMIALAAMASISHRRSRPHSPSGEGCAVRWLTEEKEWQTISGTDLPLEHYSEPSPSP